MQIEHEAKYVRFPEHVKSLANMINDPIIIIDLNGQILFINDASIQFIDIKKVQPITESLWDWIEPEYHTNIKLRLNTVLEREIIEKIEIWVPTIQGLNICIKVLISSLNDFNENPIGFLFVIQDVLVQTHLEQKIKHLEKHLSASEANYQSLINSASLLVSIFDGTGPLFFNQVFLDTLGYSINELLDPLFDLIEKVVAPEDITLAKDRFQRRLAGEDVISQYELNLVAKDGTKIPVQVNIMPITYNGHRAFQFVFINLSAKKHLSYHQDSYLASILETSSDAIIATDKENRINLWNPAAETLLGYNMEDVLRRALPFFGGDFTEEGESIWHVNKLNKPIHRYETTFLRKDGTAVPIELSLDLKINSLTREYEGAVCILRDITARKNLERALRDSEEKYRLLVEQAPNLIALVQPPNQVIFLNRALLELTGLSESESILPGFSWFDFVVSDELEVLRELLVRTFVGEDVPHSFEFTIRSSTGEHIPVLGNFVVFEYQGEKTIQCIMTDIRERKKLEIALQQRTTELSQTNEQLRQEIHERERIEAALREKERRYRALFEQSNDAVFIINPDHTAYLEVNKRAADMLGYNVDELIGMSPISIIASTEIKDSPRRIALLKEQHNLPLYESVFQQKDGTEVPVELNVEMLYDSKGTPIHMQSIARDITTRINAKNALRAERDRVQQYIEIAGSILFVLDPNRRITLFNKKGCDILGYSEAEILGKDFDMLIPDRFKAGARSRFFQAMAGFYVYAEDFEGIALTKSGEERNLIARNTILKDESGMIFGLLSAAEDITERKKAEESLRMERDKFQNYLDVTRTIFIALDSNRNIIMINNKACTVLGYNEAELIGTNFDIIRPPHLRVSARARFFQAMAGEIQLFDKEIETVVITKSGEERIIVWNTTIITDHTGNIVGSISSGEDVTERKRSDKALKYRYDFETLITTLSTHFINLAPHETDAGIQKALKAIGEFAGVDRSFICMFSDADSEMAYTYTHEWCAEGIEPRISLYQRIPVDRFPWWAEQIKRGDVYHVPRATDLPVEAQAIKKRMREIGVKSVINLPLTRGGTLIGYLGFHALRSEKSWSDDIIVLLKIVGEMLVSAMERQKAEIALQYRTEFEALITNLSTHFINLAPEDIDTGITHALQTIGEFVGVDRSFIGLLSDDLTKMTYSYEWCELGVESLKPAYLEGLDTAKFPWWAELVKNHEIIYIPQISDLPDEAIIEKEAFHTSGIQSSINVPMIQSGHIVGLVGFHSIRSKTEWTDDTIALLKIVGELLLNSLERKSTDEELMAREYRYRALFEQTNDAVFLISPDNISYIEVNQRAADLLGYEVDELVNTSPKQIIAPIDMPDATEKFARMQSGSKLSVYQRTFYRKDGTPVPVELSVSMVYEPDGTPIHIQSIARVITNQKTGIN